MTNAKHDVTPESIQAALDDLHIPFRALKAQRGPALTRFILEPVGTLDIAAQDNAQDALFRALNVRAVSIVAPLPCRKPPVPWPSPWVRTSPAAPSSAIWPGCSTCS